MKRRHIDDELLALVFCLLGIMLLSSAIGYAVERRALILVPWDSNGAAVQADQSPSFEMLNFAHLGNPFWFLR